MEKKHTLVYGIKGKLISALCMLLVAMIMVVSSTYAWFTLSTAPEITGISTTIGANGALEMALITKKVNGQWDIKDTAVGDAAIDVRNQYWGNLVDVSNSTFYGWDLMNLYPSELNVAAGGKIIDLTSPLKTPSYGADGRIESLEANTLFGSFKNGDFFKQSDTAGATEGYGVRAIGSISGMTKRQLSFRNNLSAAANYKGAAKNLASASLNTNGASLANIAIKKQTFQATEGNPTLTYTSTEIAPLLAIVNDLVKAEGVIANIEASYIAYIHAYIASKAGVPDANDEVIYAAIQSACDTADELYAAAAAGKIDVSDQGSVTLPAGVATAINALAATKATVNTAKGQLEALTGDAITWDQLSTPLNSLVNINAMTINDIPVSQVRDKMQDLINSVLGGKGMIVTMVSTSTASGGVYVDIADHCGDYTASVKLQNISYGGLTVEQMDATMKTKSGVTPAYLDALGSVFTGETSIAPEAGSTANQPLSEYYGYVLDMAFRTNASESNLHLEIDGADRIYSDNAQGASTQGNGSYVLFSVPAGTTDMGEAKVKTLMTAVRIVFYNTDDGTVIAYAKLGTPTVVDGGYKASIQLCAQDGTPLVDDASTTVDERTKLMALTANTPTTLSTLVYLDGNTVTNGSVSATGLTSVKMEMNIQFKSDANLVPMKDGNLYNPGETTAAESESNAG